MLAIFLGFLVMFAIIISLLLEGGISENMERSKEKKEQRNFEREKINDIIQKLNISQEGISESQEKFLDYYYRKKKRATTKDIIVLIINLAPIGSIVLITLLATYL